MKVEREDKIVLSEGSKVIVADKQGLDACELVNRLEQCSLVQTTYRFFDVTVCIRSDSRELIDQANRMYGYFEVSQEVVPDVTLYGVLEGSVSSAEGNPLFLTVPSSEKDYRLRKGAVYYYVSDEALLVERVLLEMEIFVLMNVRNHYFIHGGMVSLAEKGIAFPAPTLGGKTTLALALVKRGCKFLTDEYVAINTSTLKASPFPRNPSVRIGTFALLSGLETFRMYNSESLPDEKEQHNVDIGALYPGCLGRACKVNYLIFPRYDKSREPKLTEISGTRAIAELVDKKALLSLGWRDKKEVLDMVVRLVEGAQCFRLVANEVNETADLVLDMVRSSK